MPLLSAKLQPLAKQCTNRRDTTWKTGNIRAKAKMKNVFYCGWSLEVNNAMEDICYNIYLTWRVRALLRPQGSGMARKADCFGSLLFYSPSETNGARRDIAAPARGRTQAKAATPQYV